MNKPPTTATLAPAAAREDEYVTVAEIATHLRVAKMTIYRAIDAGDFPGTIRVGKAFRVPAAAVDAYMKAREVDA